MHALQVYLILMVQLAVTVGIICLFIFWFVLATMQLISVFLSFYCCAILTAFIIDHVVRLLHVLKIKVEKAEPVDSLAFVLIAKHNVNFGFKERDE